MTISDFGVIFSIFVALIGGLSYLVKRLNKADVGITLLHQEINTVKERLSEISQTLTKLQCSEHAQLIARLDERTKVNNTNTTQRRETEINIIANQNR